MDRPTFENLQRKMAAAMRELRGEPEPIPEAPDYAECWAFGDETKYGPHGGEMHMRDMSPEDVAYFCDNHDPDEPRQVDPQREEG